MFEIITISIMVILLAALFVAIFIIRGFLRQERGSAKDIRPLTGKEIEVIRRRLTLIGMNGLTPNDVYCLIKTIRDTNLGLWIDNDPYFPNDPYEDIDERKKN